MSNKRLVVWCWVLNFLAWRNSSRLSNQCSKLNQAMMMLGVNLNFSLQNSPFGISVKHCSNNKVQYVLDEKNPHTCLVNLKLQSQ